LVSVHFSRRHEELRLKDDLIAGDDASSSPADVKAKTKEMDEVIAKMREYGESAKIRRAQEEKEIREAAAILRTRKLDRLRPEKRAS
jgi:hypothetical protein